MENTSNEEKWSASQILVVLFFGWIAWSLFSAFIGHFWGTKEIDAIFEAPRPYEAKYYVYLFPDGKNAKNYKVPGDITVDSYCDSDGEGNSGCSDVFLLQRVYFSNGGSIAFDECDLAESTYCRDDDGNDWDIEFHKELVK